MMTDDEKMEALLIAKKLREQAPNTRQNSISLSRVKKNIKELEKKMMAQTSLHKKLLAVQKDLPAVAKNGYNNFSKYKYVTETDAIGAVSPLLAREELLHFTSLQSSTVETLQKGGAYYSAATVQIKLTILDPETGAREECIMAGYAEDKNNDKALYKAITGANKYAYLKFFGLSTDDDPENDEDSQEKPQAENLPDFKGPSKRDVINEIGFLMNEFNLNKEEFMYMPAIKTPLKATIEDLQAALDVIRQTCKAKEEAEALEQQLKNRVGAQ